MPKYRITLDITEPLPEKLSKKNLSLDGSEIFVTTGKSRSSLEIFPILSDNPEIAMLIARHALNNLLNYFASVVQFRGILTPGYKYESTEDSGTVVEPGTGILYVTKVDVPDGFSLGIDRRAAAFLRRGDSSNDPFDSFRNYYLAVDTVGKSLKPGVKDSKVLLETLKKVTKPTVLTELETNLRSALKELKEPYPSSLDPVKALNKVLYSSFRCSLMHSGSTTDFTPFNPKDERQVLQVLKIMRGVAWQYVQYERGELTKTV